MQVFTDAVCALLPQLIKRFGPLGLTIESSIFSSSSCHILWSRHIFHRPINECSLLPIKSLVRKTQLGPACTTPEVVPKDGRRCRICKWRQFWPGLTREEPVKAMPVEKGLSCGKSHCSYQPLCPAPAGKMVHVLPEHNSWGFELAIQSLLQKWLHHFERKSTTFPNLLIHTKIIIQKIHK